MRNIIKLMETFDDAVIERGLGRLAKARIGHIQVDIIPEPVMR
jgi:hypothetical protein